MIRLLFFLILILVFSTILDQRQSWPQSANYSVFFSLNGGCIKAIIHEVDTARSSILVQAYSFTSAPISKALLNAHKRGVKVEILLDKSQRSEKYSSADFFAHGGIPTKIDSGHAIAHNKIMIIDGKTVVTGSFNFTKAAEERNAENLLIIKDKCLCEKYVKNWHEHAAHSEVYRGRGANG